MNLRYGIRRVETVRKVKARQAVWADWMQASVEGLSDDDKVVTVTVATPTGKCLIAIEACEGDNQVA